VVARDENFTRASWDWFGKNGSFMSSAGVNCVLKWADLLRPQEINDENVTFQATKSEIERKIAKSAQDAGQVRLMAISGEATDGRGLARIKKHFSAD
jgi:hypothetical protein